MVSNEPEFVGGCEGEEVLPHAAGLDPVTASEKLEAGFVELVSGLDLGADDDPPTVKLSELRGMTVEGTGH